MKNSKVLRKVLAVSLAAAMLTATGFSSVGSYIGTSVSVSAATYGDFQYTVSNNTVTIEGYSGSGGQVTIPSTIDGKSVTTIGYSAFYGCTNLTSVTIPNSVTTIGEDAFWHCTNLTSVTIPDSVTTIDGDAFCGCTNLTSVTIPPSVTSIGSDAFGYYYNNGSYQKVGGFTITGYTGTAAETYANNNGFTFVSLGTTGQCGTNATYTLDSNGLLTISGTGAMYDYGEDSPFSCNPNVKNVVIESGITTIGCSAFEGCTNLTSVTIPDSVTTIGSYAFYACTSLTSVTIPDSVTTIGEWAFDGCTSLTSVTIPPSVTSISEKAFGYYYNNNGSYQKVSGFTIEGYENTAAETYANDNGFTFLELETIIDSGSCGQNVTYALNRKGTLTISGTGAMDDYDEDSPFSGNQNIKNVIIETGVTAVGNSAFDGCDNLETISFPYTLTSIGDYAFYGCAALASVTFPDNLRTVGESAFYDCTLQSVTLPETVRTIGDTAFGYYYYKRADKKIDGFTISGFTNSAAETYASANGFAFVSIGVADPFENTSSLSTDEITIGESVTVNLSATADNCTFKVLYKKVDDAQWVEKNVTGSTYTLTPAKAEDYNICVVATDTNGNVVKEFMNLIVNPTPLVNESTLSSETVTLGDSITIQGAASGGKGKYNYAVYYKKTNNTTWVMKQGFRTTANVEFTPSAVAEYNICVVVKDAEGSFVKKYMTLSVKSNKLQNVSMASAKKVKQGSAVTINCNAEGGSGKYTYAVYYKRLTDTNWTTKQNYSENATVSITPAKQTEYNIMVKVKDSDGSISKKYFTVSVVK